MSSHSMLWRTQNYLRLRRTTKISLKQTAYASTVRSDRGDDDAGEIITINLHALNNWIERKYLNYSSRFDCLYLVLMNWNETFCIFRCLCMQKRCLQRTLPTVNRGSIHHTMRYHERANCTFLIITLIQSVNNRTQLPTQRRCQYQTYILHYKIIIMFGWTIWSHKVCVITLRDIWTEHVENVCGACVLLIFLLWYGHAIDGLSLARCSGSLLSMCIRRQIIDASYSRRNSNQSF